MRPQSIRLALAAASVGLLSAGSSGAATSTGSLPVSALVLKSCSVAATPLAFGNYDPTAGAPTDANTTLVVLCTTGTSFQVGLNAGGGSGASIATRKMTSGSDTLAYTLYQDSSRSTLWGNTPGTDTPSATTAAVPPTTLTVYGRVPSGQNVPLGLYNDNVTVTLTY